jgi:hypothetical protein
MNFMFNLNDYETVESRISKFWKDYPDGRIETELIEAASNRFIVEARIFRTEADAKAWSIDYAAESFKSDSKEAEFALERCSTSAIGRALATAGFATKRPSREEMTKVARVEMAHKKEYIPVEKEDDPWTIRTVEAPKSAAEAVAIVKDIIGGTTDKDIPNCGCGKPRILRTGTAKTGKQWAAWDCCYKSSNYQVGQQKPCDPERIWLELNSNGQWQPQKARG